MALRSLLKVWQQISQKFYAHVFENKIQNINKRVCVHLCVCDEILRNYSHAGWSYLNVHYLSSCQFEVM